MSGFPVWIACCLALLAALPALAGDVDAAVPAQADCEDAVIQAVQARHGSIQDLRAEFSQVSRSVVLAGSAGAGAITSRGEVVFARPDRMRWDYREPEPSLTVSDGETLWVYDPTRAEAQRMTQSGGYFSGAAVQFLLGSGDLRSDFEVRAISCSDASAELELVPRKDASYERIRVLVDRASSELRRTTLVDLLGNVTEVTFNAIRVNQKPDPAVFVFEPPDGVTVIDLDVP